MDGPQQWVRKLADAPSRRGDESTGFPFGTALVLFLVLGASALFSCCYHWEKFRNMNHRRHSQSAATAGAAGGSGENSSPWPTSRSSLAAPAISLPSSKGTPLQESRRSLPVMMPGDDVPKFLAMPSPHGFAPGNVGGGELAASHINQTKRYPHRQ